MEAITIKNNSARFDTRLPKEQKNYFEKAAQIGGFRNLTAFILSAASEKAKDIITEKEKIIASRRDSEIFFNAILRQTKPNYKLQKAINEYKQAIVK